MPLPHIRNSQAGVNKYDPVNVNMFEVYFTLPEPLRAEFGKDEALLSEHVIKVEGLDALNKAPEVVHQKFKGTDRSYLAPKISDTFAEITVGFTLNLRNEVDNYIFKLFKAWSKLGYDINTGEKHLKKDYCADWMKISVANSQGDIYREIVFKDVMINGNLDGLSNLDYETTDPQELTVKFVSDWWDEVNA